MIHHRRSGRRKSFLAPPAWVTLRAHRKAPARVELAYNPTPGRVLRAAAWVAGLWSTIPLVLWLPPHYPWVITAFLAGIYLSYRSWHGRYTIRSFAGVCPRCGAPLALGVDRLVDLPHTLTCYSCHFEPRLEVTMGGNAVQAPIELAHQKDDCVGEWTIRWLADEPFVFCEECRAGGPATPEMRALADGENDRGDLLGRLADEGWPLI